jgi:hypothetical protein
MEKADFLFAINQRLSLQAFVLQARGLTVI